MSSVNITTAIESITPEMAKAYLARNTRNRAIRSSDVNVYASLMKSGKWMLNGDAIRFDCTGTLIDGQQRLTAIVRTGMTVNSVVVRGLPPESFETIDRQRRRSVGDVLHIHGHKNASKLAATAVFVWIEEMGRKDRVSWSLGSDRPDAQSLVGVVNRHPSLPPSVSHNCSLAWDYLGWGAVAAWFLFRIESGDTDRAQRFKHALYTGESLSSDNPILLFRERFVGTRKSRFEIIPPRDRAGVLVNTWNAWCDGRGRKQIKVPKSTDTFPEFRHVPLLAYVGPDQVTA